jgi:hypothetical protein
MSKDKKDKMTTMTKVLQDSAFYTNESGTEVVWDSAPHKRFYVVRAGEMRIHATDASGVQHTIRYTDQLRDFGIKDDAALAEWGNKDEEFFCWINNSWFEVYDSVNKNWYSEPIHSLDEAINFAKELSAKYGKDTPVGDDYPGGDWF